jgi:hypothetical protein
MFAAGEFGDHPAVFLMGLNLGGDHGGKDRAAVFNDGGGGLVTGGFDG